jgi:phosphoribosylformylglycinamidine synthase
VLLLGEGSGELGGSEYLYIMHGLIRGTPPSLDLKREAALQQLLVRAAAAGLLESAHDLSEGGLAVTLAECCFDSGQGVDANVAAVAVASRGMIDIATLFGESASRALVSVAEDRLDELIALARDGGVPATVIGRVGGERVRISVDGRPVVDEPRAELERIWANALEEIFESSRVAVH